MATLLQLVNQVLRRTGQVEVSTLTNANTPALQTKDFLNEIYFEMLQTLRIDRLMKQATFNTANGTANYSLVSDADVNMLLNDSVVQTTDQQVLQPVDYSYPLSHGLTASGKPTVFYTQGSQLYLYPIPNGVYPIRYNYLVKPQTLSSDNATTELPVEWERVLLRGAQALLEEFLGEGGVESFSLYRDNLATLRAKARLKPHSRLKGFYLGASSSANGPTAGGL